MELGPRDRLSQAFVHEVEKGRTIDSPYGPIVHLDLRHLGEKLIDAKLPFVRELCLKYERHRSGHRARSRSARSCTT